MNNEQRPVRFFAFGWLILLFIAMLALGVWLIFLGLQPEPLIQSLPTTL